MPVSVSILMPVRNGGPALAKALESIRNQTFSDWELIVVDDGSTDSTPQVLADFSRCESRCQVLRQPAFGIVAALRCGCAAATGHLIARMDADDWMHPERLERQVCYLEHQPEIGLVSCRVRFGGDRERHAGYAAHVDWVNSLLTPERISLERFVESPLAHPTVMFRRELIERWGGYREGAFPEDYELWLRWLGADVKFGKVDAELLTWNDPPHRASRLDSRYDVDAFYRLKAFYLAQWLRSHVAPARLVWLWGAGRLTRKRFRALEREGIRLEGFIDIAPKRAGIMRDGRPVLLPEDLPSAEESFILAGVATRGARAEIRLFLESAGRQEGVDFLLVA